MKRILFVLLLTAGCDKPAEEAPPQTSVQNQTAAQTAGQTTVQIAVQTGKNTQGLGVGTPEQVELLMTAKADFLADNWDAAQVVFEKLATTGPISGPQVTAMIALAEIYKSKNETAKASALYMDLLARAPDIAEVQFIAGRSLAENGETTKGIAAYEKAIALDSNYLQAFVELGGLYVKAGRTEDANKTFLLYEQRIYTMAKVLEDKAADPIYKLEILEVFSFVKDDRANQAIIGALVDPVPEVRERAVTLTEEFFLGEAVETIRRLSIEDPDTRVRIAARGAIDRLEGASKDGARPTFVKSEGELGTAQ